MLCCAVLCPCRLNLRENELEDEGAVTLARGLATLPALQVRQAGGCRTQRFEPPSAFLCYSLGATSA